MCPDIVVSPHCTSGNPSSTTLHNPVPHTHQLDHKEDRAPERKKRERGRFGAGRSRESWQRQGRLLWLLGALSLPSVLPQLSDNPQKRLNKKKIKKKIYQFFYMCMWCPNMPLCLVYAFLTSADNGSPATWGRGTWFKQTHCLQQEKWEVAWKLAQAGTLAVPRQSPDTFYSNGLEEILPKSHIQQIFLKMLSVRIFLRRE